MSSPIDSMDIVDNVLVRMVRLLRVGDYTEGHAHTFDHITLLATGAVLMEHPNGSQEFRAPHLIVTPKDIAHKFTALEPQTLYCCIHAIRDENNNIVAPDTPLDELWRKGMSNEYKI